MEHVPEQVAYDATKRETYREIVAKERGEHIATKQAVGGQLEGVDSEIPALVAVATKGGGRINQHFGHAKEFQVYEVSGKGVGFIGHRKVEDYCKGGWGDDAALDGVIQALEGIDVVLCSKIGDCPKDSLQAAGILATDAYAHEWIEAGIGAWYSATFGTKAPEAASSQAVA
jgi:nitrogen fixation protein NifB